MKLVITSSKILKDFMIPLFYPLLRMSFDGLFHYLKSDLLKHKDWVLFISESPVHSDSWQFRVGGMNRRPVLVVVWFSSVQSCLTLCDSMNHSMPGLPSITHSQSPPKLMSINLVMPSSHLSSPSPAPNPSWHQGLFQ